MPLNLLFTTDDALWKVIKSTAEMHALKVKASSRHHGFTEWTIVTEVTLSDLCNFLNALGIAGVESTCSEPKHAES